MKSKKITFLATSLLGLTFAITGCNAANSQATNTAQTMVKPNAERPMDDQMHHMKGGFKGGMGERHMAELNLTDAQKTQLQALRTQSKAQMQKLHETLKQYDDNIATQKKAGASTATLLGLHQQKQAVMQQIMSLRQQQQQQFLSILTPEQQLKLYESRGDHQNQDKERRVGRHGNIKGSNSNNPNQPPMPPVAPVAPVK